MNAEFVLSTGDAKVVGTDFGDGDAEDFGVRGGLGRQTWQAAVFHPGVKGQLRLPRQQHPAGGGGMDGQACA